MVKDNDVGILRNRVLSDKEVVAMFGLNGERDDGRGTYGSRKERPERKDPTKY